MLFCSLVVYFRFERAPFSIRGPALMSVQLTCLNQVSRSGVGNQASYARASRNVERRMRRLCSFDDLTSGNTFLARFDVGGVDDGL